MPFGPSAFVAMPTTAGPLVLLHAELLMERNCRKINVIFITTTKES